MDEVSETCFFCLEGNSETNTIQDHSEIFPCSCSVRVHPQCLNTWMENEDRCPICKTPVEREENEQMPSRDDIITILRDHYVRDPEVHVLRPPTSHVPSLSHCEKVFLILVICTLIILLVYPGLDRLGISL